MKKGVIFSALLLLMVIIVYIGNRQSFVEVFNERNSVNNPEIVHISLEEKVGQLFIIGHWTETPLASTTDLVKKHKLGGVIVMDAPENPEDIKTWTKTWQDNSATPLFITIDQEGGVVSRLKGKKYTTTGQREIKDAAEAYEVGKIRGAELNGLGINMNFAPVLDNTNSSSSFMYSRTFSNRETSATLAGKMIDGMKENDVLAVAKHFPGHDDTADDSHKTLPVVNIERNKLDEYILPFYKLINENSPQALMTAHIVFPQIAEQPVTLSHFFLTEYLRDELNFDGIIITDDMSMDAINNTWTAEEASVLSLQAGADIILFSSEPTEVPGAIEAVKTAITNGTLSEERINNSYNRIIKTKKNNLN